VQVLADLRTGRIVATAFSPGRQHDFALFLRSRLPLLRQTQCLADRGYLGLVKCHPNSRLPRKKSKYHPLTPAQRASNRQLAKERLMIEHIMGRLKVFRIF
jgi:hypothetical protein